MDRRFPNSTGPMNRLRAVLVPLLVLGIPLLAGPVVTQLAAGGAVHLELLRAEPAADTVLAESPTEIRLFFSEPPSMNGTTVRLADAAEELVATSETAADTLDARQVLIEPVEPLAPGAYTVHWRAIAQDGHALRDEFSFRVAPE